MILQGVRVLDLTVFVQGALGSAMLGDLGAEVIKVDPPGGDPVLGTLSSFGVPQTVESDGRTYSIQYELANRNKTSICLDLKSPAGQRVVKELIKKSDILVTNQKMSTLERLSLGYPAVAAINPRIVYVHSSIFGSKGPDADVPGFDISGVGRGGLMFAASSNGEPVYPVGALGDVMGATMTGLGALVGYIARERHGVGQCIETSQLGSVTWLQSLALSTYLLGGTEYRTGGDFLGSNPLFDMYRCADGEWIALAIYQGDRFWSKFCTATGREDWLEDARFANQSDRSDNAGALTAQLAEHFGGKPRDTHVEAFREHGIPFAPINRIPDVAVDDQIIANGYIGSLDHPALGPISMPVLPFTLSGTPLAPLRAAPEPGGNLDSVLRDVCAFDEETIGALAVEGAFG